MRIQSIGFRLILGGLLAVLIPLIINGWLAVQTATEALSGISITAAKDRTVLIADLIQQKLRPQKELAQLLANNGAVRRALLAIKEYGMAGAKEPISELEKEMGIQYTFLQDSYKAIFTTDAQGNLFAGIESGGGPHKKINVANFSYFKEVKSTRQTVISDIFPSKINQLPIAVIAAPVLSENGEFLGVSGMVLNGEILEKIVLSYKLGQTGYTTMLNTKGLLLIHYRPDMARKVNIKDIPPMSGVTPSILSGNIGVGSYSIEGEKKIAAYAPVVGTQWIIVMTQSKSEFLASAIAQRNQALMVMVISLLVIGVVIFFAARAITRPINQIVEGLKDIAQGEGDLTVRLESHSKDELGNLVYWFNVFIKRIQKVIAQFSEKAESADSGSHGLTRIADALNSGAQETSHRTKSVAASMEEMDNNLSVVASSMAESAANAGMVASAAEEMTATIGEISKNIDNAAGISQNAVNQAEETVEKMEELDKAAQAISKVTETIAEISDQTNLLALNATIEAARAGEAGKGFAVVANEIKELANQTVEATGNIRAQIDGVQRTSTSSIKSIDQIREIINQVNGIITTIATAVSEQSTATQEIAGNIAQVSQGLSEVQGNVDQNAAVSSEINKDVAEVNIGSTQIADYGKELTQSAGALQELAQALKKEVSAFKI